SASPSPIDIPGFLWPPPRASASEVVPNAIFSNVGHLGEIADILLRALSLAGYFDHSFYGVPSGFALVTRMERLKDDGTLYDRFMRWNIALQDNSYNSYKTLSGIL